MKIEKITPTACDCIRRSFENKMHELEEELGLSFKMKSIRYDVDGESAGFKVEVRTLDAVPQMVKDYNRYVSIHELPILGTKIRLNGEIYTTAGYRPRARKKPVVVRSGTGNEYVTSVETVNRTIVS